MHHHCSYKIKPERSAGQSWAKKKETGPVWGGFVLWGFQAGFVPNCPAQTSSGNTRFTKTGRPFWISLL